MDPIATGLITGLFGLFGSSLALGIVGAVVGYQTKIKDAPRAFFGSIALGFMAGVMLFQFI